MSNSNANAYFAAADTAADTAAYFAAYFAAYADCAERTKQKQHLLSLLTSTD